MGMNNDSNMTANTVETFTMGLVATFVFRELQMIFQNYYGDMGATKLANIDPSALSVMIDRGFVTTGYDYRNRPNGIVPSERALAALHLELANGARCSEPRDAFDAKLVANRPAWAE